MLGGSSQDHMDDIQNNEAESLSEIDYNIENYNELDKNLIQESVEKVQFEIINADVVIDKLTPCLGSGIVLEGVEECLQTDNINDNVRIVSTNSSKCTDMETDKKVENMCEFKNDHDRFESSYDKLDNTLIQKSIKNEYRMDHNDHENNDNNCDTSERYYNGDNDEEEQQSVRKSEVHVDINNNSLRDQGEPLGSNSILEPRKDRNIMSDDSNNDDQTGWLDVNLAQPGLIRSSALASTVALVLSEAKLSIKRMERLDFILRMEKLMTLGLSRPIGDLLNNPNDLNDGFQIHNIYDKEKSVSTHDRKTSFTVSSRSRTDRNDMIRNAVKNRYQKIIL
jgi:hypothetical protein